MAKTNNEVREPFFHIAKRNGIDWYKAWIIRAVAIIAALGVSSLVLLLLTQKSPIEAGEAVIKASFGSSRKVWNMLQDLCMLLCIALAVTPAFKMRFWNLGAQGQVLFGGLLAVACMFKIGDSVPSFVLILIMLVAAVAGGIIWAVVPAFFKAQWNTNESLFTLMMNYIAIQLVSVMINIWVPSGSCVMGVVNPTSQNGWLPSVFGQKYFINILSVAVLTALMYVYLKYSKHGYELSVVGESVNTAKYIGVNVKKVVIRTLVLSGAICGISGFLFVAGTDHSITSGLDRGYGFTAIIVSWLAKFNPVVMIVTSFLIVFLDRGASEIAMSMGLNESVAEIITGIIIFFIIGCEFFINYRIVRTHREG